MKNRSTNSSRAAAVLLAVAFAAAVWSPASGALPRTPTPTLTASGYPLIAVGGDIACDPSSEFFNAGLGRNGQCKHKATSDLLLAADYDAVLTLGDNQYQHGSLEAFQQSYHPTWGRFKDITRPTPGNHEYSADGALGYFAYFGDSAGTPGQGWYSFDLGSWHVVAMNSNCADVGGCTWHSPQAAWLRQDLAAHPNKCTLAYWHHPRFSSGHHGSDRAVAPLFRILYRRGVDILAAGHDHSYERFAPQTPRGRLDRVTGVRQFVVGTGGKNHYPIGQTLRHSEFHDDNHHGVLQLRLRPNGYRWRFIGIRGVTRDRGTTACS